jgi:predicted transcriptional regulator
MPIDTLKAARRLQEDDTFSPEQAERIAEILSDLDVASATKDDLDDLEERLTSRIDRLSDRIDRLDEKVATKEELKAVKSDLGKQIEETHSATIRTVVGAVAAVGAILAVVIPLAIYLMG